MPQNIGSISVSVLTVIVYYIFDVFTVDDFNENYNKWNYFVKALFINAILIAVYTSLSNVFFFEAFVVYGALFVYQLIYNLFLLRVISKKKRIAVFGMPEENKKTFEIFEKRKNYELIGFIGNVDDSAKETSNHKILGSYKNLEEIITNNKIDILIIGIEKTFSSSSVEKILNLKFKGLAVYDFFFFYEELTGKLPVGEIDEEWILFSKGFNIMSDSVNQKIKRMIDIVLAILIFIMVLPVMIISAIIIVIESRGPMFFIQERIGKDNKPFKIIKFRSMKKDAEKNGPQWASVNDSRVTNFGAFMRKTRIDELPQLVNVLRDEMTFVGPRPEREHFIKTLEKEIPFYNLRHSVKPGLTGWAQVNYKYGASVEDSYEKLQYDLYYIKNYSLVLDFVIFFKTLKTVIFGRGT